jgi:hypothetical protein
VGSQGTSYNVFKQKFPNVFKEEVSGNERHHPTRKL